MSKGKRAGRFLIFIFLGICAFLIYRLISRSGTSYREYRSEHGLCGIYYLLNVDGMKGLGHAALMLTDEQGEGRIFSYNGMQYNLAQCLLGKEGIGKMKEFFLDREGVEELLDTGTLPAGEYEECSNFDRALWRKISREQYEIVVQAAEVYIAAGDDFERLYAALYERSGEEAEKLWKQIEDFPKREGIPLYQIYTHNCDTAARELMGAIDDEVSGYNESAAKLTPNGNYRNMCRKLGDTWGFRRLGEDTFKETLLNYLM